VELLPISKKFKTKMKFFWHRHPQSLLSEICSVRRKKNCNFLSCFFDFPDAAVCVSKHGAV